MTTHKIEMIAFLQEKALRHTEAYVKAGRRFAPMDIADLNRAWVVSFKVCVRNWRDPNAWAARDDIEAELRIRGQQPPWDLVTDEMDHLRRTVEEALTAPYKGAEAGRQDRAA